MNTLKGYFQKHIKAIKYIFIALLVLFSFFAIRSELQHIKIEDLRVIFSNLSIMQILIFIVMGILAFIFQIPYDFLMTRQYNIQLKLSKIVVISWICQSFNNFIGIVGLTGIALRSKLYKNEGVEKGTAMKGALLISFSSLLGLFFLSLPGIFELVQLDQIKFIPLFVLLFILVVLYLFIDKLPFHWLKKQLWLQELTLSFKIKISGISILEWLVSALYFAYVIQVFQPEITLLQCILVYLIAMIIGLISMIPGGLGSFEGAVLVLFGQLNYDNTQIVIGLLIFRIGYTLIPWFIGVLLLTMRNLNRRNEIISDEDNDHLLRRFLGTLVFFSGLILGISVVTPEIFTRITILHLLFPRIVPILSNGLTFAFAILLIVLSRGIFAGVKKAYYASLVVLLSAAMTCIFKGLDYEEAILLIFVAVSLYAGRQVFVRSSINFDRKNVLKVLLISTFSLLMFILIFNFFHERGYFQSHNVVSIRYLQENLPVLILFFIFIIALGMAIIFTTQKFPGYIESTPEEIKIFEEIRERYPNSPYTQLYFMKDKNLFFNSNKNVAILYGNYNEHIIALGDPIGEPEEIDDAIDELVMWAEDQNRIVTFYEISGKYLDAFINNGFSFLKIGENAHINLEKFTLAGSHAKSHRQVLKKMEEQNYNLITINHPSMRIF